MPSGSTLRVAPSASLVCPEEGLPEGATWRQVVVRGRGKQWRAELQAISRGGATLCRGCWGEFQEIRWGKIWPDKGELRGNLRGEIRV